MTSLYHLHTPKTGGHWVDSKILVPIEKALSNVGVDLIIDHAGWYHVEDDTYITNYCKNWLANNL